MNLPKIINNLYRYTALIMLQLAIISVVFTTKTGNYTLQKFVNLFQETKANKNATQDNNLAYYRNKNLDSELAFIEDGEVLPAKIVNTADTSDVYDIPGDTDIEDTVDPNVITNQTKAQVYPLEGDNKSLGTSEYRWRSIFAKKFTLDKYGNLHLDGELIVSDIAKFKESLNISDDLNVNGSSNLSGDVTVNNLSVTGTLTQSGTTSFTDGTFSGDLAINGGDLTSTSSTFNLLNSSVTNLNIGGDASTINLGGGSGSTGCTLNSLGNLVCSGSVTTSSTTGDFGFWNRAGTTLSPKTTGDNITTSGILSTTNRLGIGTTAPTYKVDIDAGSNTRGLNIINEQDTQSDIYGVYSEVDLNDGDGMTAYGYSQYGGYFKATGDGTVGYSYGVYGVSDASDFNEDSIGVAGEGYTGVYGTGTQYGLRGSSSGGYGIYASGLTNGGYFTSTNSTTTNNYGVFGEVFGSKTVSHTGNKLTNSTTSSTNSITKTGLELTSTGNWTGSSAINRGLFVNATGGTTNYGTYITANNSATTNVGLYASASNGTNNYAAIFPSGYVGIGSQSPTSPLYISYINSALSGDFIGNYTDITQTTGTGGTTYAYRAIARAAHSSGALGLQANSTQLFFSGGGTTGTAEGLTSAATVGASTTVNNLYMLRVFSPTNSGTIGGLRGIYLGNMTGATTNYSIYSEGGSMYHAGNIGVGTATPTNSRLVVDGDGTGNYTGQAGYEASIEGDLYVTGDCVETGGACADFAEYYPVSETVTAGEIVSIDDIASRNSVVKKAVSGETVLGIVSSNPGITLKENGGLSFGGVDGKDGSNNKYTEEAPIALAGRVPVRIASDSSDIQAGDYLTLSSKEAGKAVKATVAGVMIGKALESWSVDSDKETIMVFVGTQYADPNFATNTTSIEKSPISNNYATADDINLLQGQIDSLNTTLSLLGNDIEESTDSASENNTDSELKAKLDNLQVNNILKVLGTTELSTTNIAGKLTVGLITIDDVSNSIDSLVEPLKFQSSSVSDIEFFNGHIKFGSGGTAIFEDSIEAKKVRAEKYEVLGASAGVATIEAGDTKVLIQTDLLTEESLIYLTVKNNPVPVAYKIKDMGSFEIIMDEEQSVDLNINWWIIN